MQIQMALGKLDQFGKATRDADKGHRILAQIFQHPAHKVAHIKNGVFGQAVKCPNGSLGRLAGCPGNMVTRGGARHINAAMDGMDPRRTAERDDNPCGAQNR